MMTMTDHEHAQSYNETCMLTYLALDGVCVRACVRAYVCIILCERERERENVCVCVCLWPFDYEY